jgi:hypothetical protein
MELQRMMAPLLAEVRAGQEHLKKDMKASREERKAEMKAIQAKTDAKQAEMKAMKTRWMNDKRK